MEQREAIGAIETKMPAAPARRAWSRPMVILGVVAQDTERLLDIFHLDLLGIS